MHKQLIGIVLAAMSLPIFAFVVPLALLISWNAEHRAVAAATQQATALAAMAGSLTDRSLPPGPVDGVATSVFFPDGRVLGVPAPRTAAVEKAVRCTPSTTETGDDVEVLVPVGATGGCTTVVRVLVGESALHRNRTTLVLLVLSLTAALVLVGVLLAESLGRGLLRSVRDLASAADRMATGDLTARATTTGPAEIRTTAAQLNLLAVRVDHLLHEQRQRSADIAHRLRTPLTSLRLDIDAVRDRDAAQRLISGHRAVTTALDEVIRTSRRASAETPAVTDLARTAATRAMFWSVLARDSGRTIHVDVGSGPLPVRASRASLEAAVDAMLGNIFAHTPAGVSVWLKAQRRGDDVTVLTVDDSGPGFDDLDVVERGRSGGNSTGLGLDIARRTAEEGAGELRLGASPQGGARVELRFATPPPTS
ncbi:MAG: sensor histidine kinase [Pseudonocardia sp.]